MTFTYYLLFNLNDLDIQLMVCLFNLIHHFTLI